MSYRGFLINFLLQCAAGKPPSDYQKHLFEQITSNDISHLNAFAIGPLAAYIVWVNGFECNSEVLKKLKSIELTAKYFASLRKKTLLELNNVCGPHYLLKGSSLVYDVYPQEWIRLMGDIDLLVLCKQLDQLKKCLNGLAYKQISKKNQQFYENHHHLMPYYHPEYGTWIEVHTGVFSKQNKILSEIFNAELFFKNCESFHLGDKKFLRPTPELNVLYIMMHWVLEFRVRDSVGQLLDIIYLLQKIDSPINWTRLINFANQRIPATCLHICVSYLVRIDVIEVEEHVLEKIRKKNKTIGCFGDKIMYKIILSLHSGDKNTLSVLGENNLAIIWKELIKDRKIYLNYVHAIISLLAPPRRMDRYSIKFQFKRLKNVFNRY